MFSFLSMYLIIGVIHTITFVSLLIDDGEDLLEDENIVWATKLFLVTISWPITTSIMFICLTKSIIDRLCTKKRKPADEPIEFE